MKEYHCSVCGKSIWMEYEPSKKHLVCSECKGKEMKKAEFHKDFHGVCSKGVSFSIHDRTIHGIHFTGGCPGCTRGIEKLAEGMEPAELVSKLSGIICPGRKNTSCPDQLAGAVREAMGFIEE